jgi:hypothetical protein
LRTCGQRSQAPRSPNVPTPRCTADSWIAPTYVIGNGLVLVNGKVVDIAVAKPKFYAEPFLGVRNVVKRGDKSLPPSNTLASKRSCGWNVRRRS